MSRVRDSALAVLGVVVLIALWQIIGSTGVISRSLPAFTDVITTMVEQAALLTRSAWATTERALVGGLFGFVLGCALATLAMLLPRTESLIVRYAVLINAVPVVALGPILMSFDVREHIPAIFAGLSVLFSTTLTVTDGLGSGDTTISHVFQVNGSSRWQMFRRARLPAALPVVADAVKLAVPAAMLGSLLGEWFGAERGLGVLMVSSMRNVQYSLLWSAALAAVLISMIGFLIAMIVEQRATKFFGRTVQLRTNTDAGQDRSRGHQIGFLVGVVILIVIWQLWVTLADIPAIVAPRPVGVLHNLVQNWAELLQGAGVTAGAALGGLVAGAVVGIGLALLVELLPLMKSMLTPVALLIPTVPIVVVVPILGSLLGYGMQTVFAASILMAFFPIYTLTLSGLGARPPGAEEVFSVYGAGRLQRLLRLAFPSAIPSIMLSLRMAAANCVLITLSSEWLLGQGGLGRIFSERRVHLDNDGSWAAVIIAVVLAVTTYLVAQKVERVVVRTLQGN